MLKLIIMPMPDKFPPIPEDGPAPISVQEQLDTTEVLSVVHTLHGKAVERDERETEAGVGAGDSGRIMEKRFFVLEKNDGDESLPCPYTQMLFKPREADGLEHLTEPDTKEPSIPTVISFLIKMPNLSGALGVYFPLPEDADHWNDFVVEVDYEEEQRGRYLVNSQGVVPFPSSDAMDDASAHIQDSGDLFYVPEELQDWTVPVLSASQLRRLIEGAEMERQKLPS